jgi:hypothetical protein
MLPIMPMLGTVPAEPAEHELDIEKEVTPGFIARRFRMSFRYVNLQKGLCPAIFEGVIGLPVRQWSQVRALTI